MSIISNQLESCQTVSANLHPFVFLLQLPVKHRYQRQGADFGKTNKTFEMANDTIFQRKR